MELRLVKVSNDVWFKGWVELTLRDIVANPIPSARLETKQFNSFWKNWKMGVVLVSVWFPNGPCARLPEGKFSKKIQTQSTLDSTSESLDGSSGVLKKSTLCDHHQNNVILIHVHEKLSYMTQWPWPPPSPPAMVKGLYSRMYIGYMMYVCMYVYIYI